MAQTFSHQFVHFFKGVCLATTLSGCMGLGLAGWSGWLSCLGLNGGLSPVASTMVASSPWSRAMGRSLSAIQQCGELFLAIKMSGPCA